LSNKPYSEHYMNKATEEEDEQRTLGEVIESQQEALSLQKDRESSFVL